MSSRRVLVLQVQVPFVRGGAEYLCEGLVTALLRRGHLVEPLLIPFVHHPDCLLEQMLASRLFDFEQAGDVALALKFPAYLCQHPRKRVWLLHQHRDAYDLWGHPHSSLSNHCEGAVLREAVWAADQLALPESKDIFTISKNVSRRLKNYSGLDSSVLYPPLKQPLPDIRPQFEGFFFYPSRIEPNKRQDLAIRALACCGTQASLVLAGRAWDAVYEQFLRQLACQLGLASRVHFLGEISEEEKLDLYARCQGVLFPTFDEDYGYVAAEAMSAHKPVIGCLDGGGVSELVVHQQTGYLCSASPRSLSEAIDELYRSSVLARSLGAQGGQHYREVVLSWDQVVDVLLAGL